MDFDSPWDFVWLAQMAALIVAVMAMLVACAAALAREGVTLWTIPEPYFTSLKKTRSML